MKMTRDGVCSLRIRDITPDDAGRPTQPSIPVCVSVYSMSNHKLLNSFSLAMLI